MKTDVYAFGCLYYAVRLTPTFTLYIKPLPAKTFFDTSPFQEKRGLFEIMRAVLSGARPCQQENPRMEDDAWNLVQSCWERNPSDRPPMERIVAMLSRRADP